MNDFKKIALQAARQAGEIAINNIGNSKKISLKQKNDYLTNVDIEAENIIKKIISSAFPSHGFVAEESKGERESAEYVWYIDPVSSTKNYIHGLPHFATAIALQKHGEFILSVVLDPFYHELFHAEKGHGAYLNAKKITVSSTNELQESLLFLGIKNKGKQGKSEEGITYFSKVVSHISDFRRFGSTALQLCYVACGRVDGYVHNQSDIFAIPAGKVILEEAGGKLSDFSGNPWDTASNDMVATNGLLHESLLQVIRK